MRAQAWKLRFVAVQHCHDDSGVCSPWCWHHHWHILPDVFVHWVLAAGSSRSCRRRQAAMAATALQLLIIDFAPNLCTCFCTRTHTHTEEKACVELQATVAVVDSAVVALVAGVAVAVAVAVAVDPEP